MTERHETDKEKLDAIYDLVENDVDALAELTNWETEFIYGISERTEETDFEFSEKQSSSIDEIYQKLWRKQYFT